MNVDYQFDRAVVPADQLHKWRIQPGVSAGKYHYACQHCGKCITRLGGGNLRRLESCPNRKPS